MGPAIYKQGQGFWTRTMSAIGFGLVGLMGANWARLQFVNLRIGDLQPLYVQWGAFVIVAIIAGLLIYYYVGKKRSSVDFMIATEGEMKKVNWSTRREVIGMTWVVIGLTFFIALFIALFDFLVYGPFFQVIDVIETGS